MTTIKSLAGVYAFSLALIWTLLHGMAFAKPHATAQPAATLTAPNAACTAKELEHLNIILQFVNDKEKLPSECQSLKNVTAMYLTVALCKDAVCKYWITEMMKLRNCGNPAFDIWKAVMETRLTECPRVEMETTASLPRMTNSPAAAHSPSADIQDSSTEQAAHQSKKPKTHSPSSEAPRITPIATAQFTVLVPVALLSLLHQC